VATELTAHDLLIEDLGGDILDELLEKVLLQAEVLGLKSNPDRAAQGTVIEARVEKGLGTVATTLIQRGTIRVGDPFIAGDSSGKVRMLLTDKGERVDEAGPSVPVQVVGMDAFRRRATLCWWATTWPRSAAWRKCEIGWPESGRLSPSTRTSAPKSPP